MSHICTHSEHSSRPTPGTMVLHLKSNAPLNEKLSELLVDATRHEAFPAIPRVVMTLEIDGVSQEFQLSGHVQDWFVSGEVPVVTTKWTDVSIVRRG